MIPESLAHYRIVRPLGAGGMGEVYLAEDLKLGRQVALKVLAAHVAADPERRERFEREARTIAALNHPNIVTIHSVEEDQGLLFLTMELVEGKTLAQFITPGGMALDQLLTIAIPLADAVGAAHQRAITHRDLKPANVMVSNDGRVKVLDFGLAKLRDDAAAAGETETTRALTGEGRILGTVAYMSPEQAEGKAVDVRSDVFSLGIVLFEMASGQRPFAGDTNVSVLSSILKDTPKSLTELRADLPRELAKIVKRCLQKNPERRYQTAKDLRNDLQSLKEELASGELSTPSTAAPGVPVPRKRRAWPLNGLRTMPSIAWLGDGSGLLVTGNEDLGPLQQIWVVAYPGGERRRLTRDFSVYRSLSAARTEPMFVSVAYEQRSNLWVLSAGGSREARQITSSSGMEGWLHIDWFPDGRILYMSESGEKRELAVVGADGTNRRVISDPGRLTVRPVVSRDGRQIAFNSDRSGAIEIWMMDADGNNGKHLALSRGTITSDVVLVTDETPVSTRR